jgi:hypothetical protein
LKTKIVKLKNFFIAVRVRTYGKNAVYNFVDFRIKRAGMFNYGGAAFFGPRQEPAVRNVNMVAQDPD